MIKQIVIISAIVFMLGASLPVCAEVPKKIVITRSGTVTDKDFFIPFYTPIDVPKGAQKIEAVQTFSTPSGKKCNFDLGVFDSRGYGFDSEGFRGWSGGARRSFEISKSDATPGYLPGEIYSGQWNIIQMYTSQLPLANWTINVTITLGNDKREKPYTKQFATSSLNATEEWYRIDTHVHTIYSDGKNTPQQIIEMGKAAKLDGIISTDHNTTSSLWHWGSVQDPDFIVINGMEVTYTEGHWNILGMDPNQWVDFRYHHTEPERHLSAVAKATHTGALTVANHPRNIDFLHDPSIMDGIEVWNGPWDKTDEMALTIWDNMLRSGMRKFAIAGTDYHNTNTPIGTAQTVVNAKSLSSADILSSIAAGKSYMANGSDITINMTARNTKEITSEATIGETLIRTGDVEIRFSTNSDGKLLRLLDQNGVIYSNTIAASNPTTITIPEHSKWVRAELRDAKNNDMAAMTNPIFITLPITTYPLF